MSEQDRLFPPLRIPSGPRPISKYLGRAAIEALTHEEEYAAEASSALRDLDAGIEEEVEPRAQPQSKSSRFFRRARSKTEPPPPPPIPSPQGYVKTPTAPPAQSPPRNKSSFFKKTEHSSPRPLPATPPKAPGRQLPPGRPLPPAPRSASTPKHINFAVPAMPRSVSAPKQEMSYLLTPKSTPAQFAFAKERQLEEAQRADLSTREYLDRLETARRQRAEGEEQYITYRMRRETARPGARACALPEYADTKASTSSPQRESAKVLPLNLKRRVSSVPTTPSRSIANPPSASKARHNLTDHESRPIGPPPSATRTLYKFTDYEDDNETNIAERGSPDTRVSKPLSVSNPVSLGLSPLSKTSSTRVGVDPDELSSGNWSLSELPKPLFDGRYEKNERMSGWLSDRVCQAQQLKLKQDRDARYAVKTLLDPQPDDEYNTKTITSALHPRPAPVSHPRPPPTRPLPPIPTAAIATVAAVTPKTEPANDTTELRKKKSRLLHVKKSLGSLKAKTSAYFGFSSAPTEPVPTVPVIPAKFMIGGAAPVRGKDL